MKRANFTIQINDGNGRSHPEERKGWLINECFACHKDYRDWTLTHLPTGIAAFYGKLRRRSDAQALADCLTKRADWTFTDTDKVERIHREAMQYAIGKMIHDASYNRYEWPVDPPPNPCPDCDYFRCRGLPCPTCADPISPTSQTLDAANTRHNGAFREGWTGMSFTSFPNT